jgi:hypothetical protein
MEKKSRAQDLKRFQYKHVAMGNIRHDDARVQHMLRVKDGEGWECFTMTLGHGACLYLHFKRPHGMVVHPEPDEENAGPTSDE